MSCALMIIMGCRITINLPQYWCCGIKELESWVNIIEVFSRSSSLNILKDCGKSESEEYSTYVAAAGWVNY